MKYYMLSLLIIFNTFISFSQNITIGDLEKIVKLNLYETDLSLSSMGFSYESSDSNELCKFHIFGKEKDKIKNIKEYSTVLKFFCEKINKIQYGVFDKSIYNSLRDGALKSNYKLIKTTTDESGLKSTFMNIKNNFLIDFIQGKLKTESETYTQYLIELYCRNSDL